MINLIGPAFQNQLSSLLLDTPVQAAGDELTYPSTSTCRHFICQFINLKRGAENRISNSAKPRVYRNLSTSPSLFSPHCKELSVGARMRGRRFVSAKTIGPERVLPLGKVQYWEVFINNWMQSPPLLVDWGDASRKCSSEKVFASYSNLKSFNRRGGGLRLPKSGVGAQQSKGTLEGAFCPLLGANPFLKCSPRLHPPFLCVQFSRRHFNHVPHVFIHPKLSTLPDRDAVIHMRGQQGLRMRPERAKPSSDVYEHRRWTEEPDLVHDTWSSKTWYDDNIHETEISADISERPEEIPKEFGGKLCFWKADSENDEYRHFSGM